MIYLMKKIFVTFGNNKFKNSRERIVKEATNLNIFDECFYKSENFLNNTEFKNIINKLPTTLGTGRGFYWYMWKPFIIYKTLENLEVNDILFYCDAGMTIKNNTDVINKFNNIIKVCSNKNECSTGIITFITTGNPQDRLEYMYNQMDVFNYFNVQKNNRITHTQQIQAGVICICKNKESMKIIKEWYNLIFSNPELFIGDSRVYKHKHSPELIGYRDHRHDQSIWSIISKLNNVTIFNHNSNPIYQSHKRH
ncbi:hypothetical protein crov345 [Cafeteria roenbergensis virus]|uniref:Uncharacterized protein n=1 Tax=Cafeteria roenbergensis virus (strain BV-PW1) TaxID=693272 RepID=E3T5B6_CROVB|nr:hypothetical protein crov345 [Cafeteria roenbergensis virus BV-PW1]ADO67379.1 hypothetical protein crov345 [Cafeteria roenbergensis virus BV-PW1]